MSNTYNVGWLRDNENKIFIPFTYTKSVKLDDKGNTLDSTVTTVKEHGDVIADINATLEKIKNGEIHSGIADSTKGTLTLGNKKFNGSTDITVEAKDLGITGALTYIGISTFPLTDKGIEKPYIDGKEIDIATLEKGSVVLYSNNGEVYQEYLWTGTYWELLGDEGSYAYRSISVEAGAGLTGGGTLADNFSFSVVPDNNTTVIDDNNRVAMKQLSSAGTYGQSTNVQNLEPQSTNEFSVPYFTVDDYGRIVSAQTKTIRIINDSAILDDIAQIKADIAGEDGATDNIVPRLAQVETRTKYINASSSEDDNIDESVFQITDDKGNIGVQVDNQGVKSFDFILTKTNTSLVAKLNELDVKDGELADSINKVNTDLTTLIGTTKTDLEGQINTTKSNLENKINTTESTLNNTIDSLRSDMNKKDEELADDIKELKGYTLTAGAGLTGGGDLSTSREFHVGKGTGIQINEDSIQLEAIKDLATGSYGQSTDYTSEFNGSFEIPHFTVDEFGRITSIKKVTINMPKDGEILDSIDELDDKLTKLVASTKEELQGNINEVSSTLDGRITSIYNTLDDKIDSVKFTLDAKDTELADNLRTEIGAINETIADHVTTLLNKIDENKTNIESNDQDIAALTQRVAVNEEDINDINDLNVEQGDQLARHKSDIDILDERTKNINASNDQAHNEAFYITDKDGNIGFSFDNRGFVKAPYDFFISDGSISLREIEGALEAEVLKRNKEIKDLQEKDTTLGDAIDAIADNIIVAGEGLTLNNSGALSEESITISAQVDRGLDITDDKIGHINSITAATVSGTDGSITTSITIPKITYDAQGHITKTETTTADLSSITDAIDDLDENLNNKISETEEGLLEKISEVETELKSKSILYNPGTIQVDLESNDAITYTDGGNITPGVLGILQPEHGGIGNTTGRIQIGQIDGVDADEYSTSEGYKTNASGDYSHAEGHSTNAVGKYSHAEGYGTVASGDYSHAGGHNTKASGNYSTIFGERNDSKTISLSGNANALTYSMNLSASLGYINREGSVSSSGLFTSAALPAATSSSPSSFTAKTTRVYTLKGGCSYLYKSSYNSSNTGSSTYFTPDIYLFSSSTGVNFSGLRKTYKANTDVTETITVPENSTYFIVYYSSYTTYSKRTSSTSSGYTYFYTQSGSYGSARGTPTIKEVINTEDIAPYQNGYFSTGQRIISVSTADNTITLDRTLSTSAVSNQNFEIYLDRGAKGSGSFVVGLNNSAQGEYQTVIGKNNLEDITSALIVGNGTVDQKSNAYTIDWDGNSVQTGTNTSTDFIIINEEQNISLLTKLQTYENEIDNIHITNGEQNDLLSDHDTRLISVETRTQYMDASTPDGFYITDKDGNIGFKVEEDGIVSNNDVIKAEDFITIPKVDGETSIGLKAVKNALDQEIEDRTTQDSELSDAIDEINGRINKTEGSITQPIYFNDGTPTACVENFTFYQEIGADDVDPSTSSTFCVLKTGDTMSGPLISTGFIGPLTGTADKAKNLVDSSDNGLSLGGITNPVYFNDGVPVACTGTTVPAGGSSGQVLIKDSSGNSVWQELVALPKGGTAGQILVKNSSTNGDGKWLSHTLTLSGDVSGSGTFDANGTLDISTTVADDSHNHTNYLANYTLTSGGDFNTATTSGAYRFNDSMVNGPSNLSWGQMLVVHGSGDTIAQVVFDYSGPNVYLRQGNPSDLGGSGSWKSWGRIWCEGNSVTSAVWNDYAEYRESDCEDFGYVLTENGDDTLSKTTERLSHFAGVSSDTWGFSQGKTAHARTPIAVAGRVLVYPYQDRNNYKPGDCVCTAPGGTVDIMTREEVINWPDRIVGTVSCVPDYEEWGGGANADRPSVKVNGRIWIKVK